MQYFFFSKLQFISFTFNLQFFNSSFLQFNLVRVEKLQIESKKACKRKRSVLFLLHEKKDLRLSAICKKDRGDDIFVSFRMFPFHGKIIFAELSFKRKCKKATSFRKCVFPRKYKIFVYDSCT